MYNTILIPLENSESDSAILNHIPGLAKLTSAQLVLIHVADGFVARNQEAFNLADSEEIEDDRRYLAKCQEDLKTQGFKVETVLARGEPAKEIVRIAEERGVDLIAMATHGHKFLGDLVLGSVAEALRHSTHIPVLMVRAAKG